MYMTRLSGQFNVVFRDDTCVAIGFTGNVSARTLTKAEVAYVRWFCNGKGDAGVSDRFVKSRFPQSNCNDFPVFEMGRAMKLGVLQTEERIRDYMPDGKSILTKEQRIDYDQGKIMEATKRN